MAWNGCFVFMSSIWLVNSMEAYYQPPRGSSIWGYFTPPLLQREPLRPRQTPMEAMVDLTNNLGVAILQDHTFSRGNFAFSPYGVASVLVVLYEGARGESARQIHRAVGFPSDKDLIRIGFRDIHRHLRSYFSHEGYLSGISLNKQTSSLKQEYKKILRFYGYDVELNQPLDEDDDVGFANPPPNVPAAPPPVTCPPKSDKDNNVGKPAASNLEGEKKNNTTIPPTDRPVKESKPGQNTTELEANTKSPSMEATIPLRTTVMPEITTELSNNETTAETGENKRELTTTENFKSTVGENITTITSTYTTEKIETTVTENLTTTPITGNTVVTESTASENITTTTITTTTTPTTEKIESTLAENISTGTSTTAAEKIETTVSENIASSTTTTTPTTTTEKIETTVAESITTTTFTPSTAKIETTVAQNITTSTTTTATEKTDATVSENLTTATEKIDTTLEENITTTTGSEMSSVSENESHTTSTTVKNDFSTTLQEEVTEGKQEISTTEKSEQNTEVTTVLGSTIESTTQSEAETEALTTTEPVTTESDKNEEVTNSNLDNGMLIPQPDDLVTAAPTEKNSTGTDSQTNDVTSAGTESTTENFWGTSKEGLDSLPETGDPIQVKNVIRVSGVRTEGDKDRKIRNIVDPKMPLWLADKPNAPKLRKARTITDYLKSPRSPDLSLQLQNGMYDTHVSRNANLYRSLPRLLFLVDGSVDTPVPMMTYTNVFPYAYIPKLHAKALEFPLDDIRYKLVILLPVERRGLRQLIYDLLDYPLSNVLDTMRPTRVKALVPTFMVEGFVILTSSLQKLGIWDVFDPRKANLSGMSMDPELYVRNVEQSVTVVIRNYVEILDIQTRTMAARYMEQEFEATHPFLYFVLDTATNVALMAGQILDPLNSRIYR